MTIAKYIFLLLLELLPSWLWRYALVVLVWRVCDFVALSASVAISDPFDFWTGTLLTWAVSTAARLRQDIRSASLALRGGDE